MSSELVADLKHAWNSLRYSVVEQSQLADTTLHGAIEKQLRELLEKCRAASLEIYKAQDRIVIRELSTEIADTIHALYGKYPSPIVERWTRQPRRVSFGNIVATDMLFVGRVKELAELDRAWDSSLINIVSLIAWGGVGKSVLVRHWLNRMKADNFRRADYVFAWSFYSGGPPVDEFYQRALTALGDRNPSAGEPMDKATRLANIIQSNRTLLILDGLEPLQHGPEEFEFGKIKDSSMRALIQDVASSNPGLCVVTSRLPLTDLESQNDSTIKSLILEKLDREAGVSLLVKIGVEGAFDDLISVYDSVAGHALSLALVGSYLRDHFANDVRRLDDAMRDIIPNEQPDQSPAYRIMQSHYKRLHEQEICLMFLLSLYDRPIKIEDLPKLLEKVTNDKLRSITDLSVRQISALLHQLNRWNLLTLEGVNSQIVNIHPLVKEFFREHEDWELELKETHKCLHYYFLDQAEEKPAETLNDLKPLYSAVIHGCEAGMGQHCIDTIFKPRIHNGIEKLSWHRFAAFSSDLAALSHYYQGVEWRKTIRELQTSGKTYVRDSAAYCLRALGRLTEAKKQLEASIISYKNEGLFENACVTSGELSEIHAALGSLRKALEHANNALDFAKKSKNNYQITSKICKLANVHHLMGDFTRADALFEEASIGSIEHVASPTGLFLYFDFLLDKAELLEWGVEPQQLCSDEKKFDSLNCKTLTSIVIQKVVTVFSDVSTSLLNAALFALAKARATALEAIYVSEQHLANAVTELEIAIDALRRSKQQQHIPKGLLSFARLLRSFDDWDRALKMLYEAKRISERGEMALYQIDIEIELGHIAISQAKKDEAKHHLKLAQNLLNQKRFGCRQWHLQRLSNVIEKFHDRRL